MSVKRTGICVGGVVGALAAGILGLASAAHAQIERAMGSTSTEYAVERDERPFEVEEKGEETIDYASRPRFVWVAQIDDYTDPLERAGHDAGDGWRSNRLWRLQISAFNGALGTARIRTTTLGRDGGIWRQTDQQVASLNRALLLDPIEYPRIDDGSWMDGTAFPSVFVVASDTPVELMGSIARWQRTEHDYNDQGFESRSDRNVPFRLVECDETGHEAVCNLPMRHASWSEWAELE